VFAGAGRRWLDTVTSPAGGARQRWLAGAGSSPGYGMSFLPSIYPAGYSNFWTSSPTYYFIKIGIMLVLMGLIYVCVQRPFSVEPRNPAWSPMLEFGRSSLFVYWIHVELAYGIFSYPLHRKLPVWWSLVAFTVFTSSTAHPPDRASSPLESPAGCGLTRPGPAAPPVRVAPAYKRRNDGYSRSDPRGARAWRTAKTISPVHVTKVGLRLKSTYRQRELEVSREADLLKGIVPGRASGLYAQDGTASS
jgi:hypothetical protein